MKMLMETIERIKNLHDPARQVTEEGIAKAVADVKSGVYPTYAAAEHTGLDVSPMAAIQRAIEQGYVDPTLHGTASDIEKFSDGVLGSLTGAKSAKEGVWTSNSPELAHGYAHLASKKNFPTASQYLRDAHSEAEDRLLKLIKPRAKADPNYDLSVSLSDRQGAASKAKDPLAKALLLDEGFPWDFRKIDGVVRPSFMRGESQRIEDVFKNTLPEKYNELKSYEMSLMDTIGEDGKIAVGQPREGQNIMSLVSRPGVQHTEAVPNSYSGSFTKQVKSMPEDASSLKLNFDNGTEFTMNRNPDDLRSKFAVFDPANKGTGLLMGGLGAVGLKEVLSPSEAKAATPEDVARQQASLLDLIKRDAGMQQLGGHMSDAWEGAKWFGNEVYEDFKEHPITNLLGFSNLLGPNVAAQFFRSEPAETGELFPHGYPAHYTPALPQYARGGLVRALDARADGGLIDSYPRSGV